MRGQDGRVTQCLVDYHSELQDQQCTQQVHRVMERASQDIRMDVALANACSEDRLRLCAGLQPVRPIPLVEGCLMHGRYESGCTCIGMKPSSALQLSE